GQAVRPDGAEGAGHDRAADRAVVVLDAVAPVGIDHGDGSADPARRDGRRHGPRDDAAGYSRDEQRAAQSGQPGDLADRGVPERGLLAGYRELRDAAAI